jgi:hypothetical protein
MRERMNKNHFKQSKTESTSWGTSSFNFLFDQDIHIHNFNKKRTIAQLVIDWIQGSKFDKELNIARKSANSFQ